MAGAYTSIRIHLMWSTKHRRPWLDPAWRPRLFAQLGAAAASRGAELLCAGGARDHVHLYLDSPGSIAPAALVGMLKSGSARWIQQTFPHRRDFRWQQGWEHSASPEPPKPRWRTISAIRKSTIGR